MRPPAVPRRLLPLARRSGTALRSVRGQAATAAAVVLGVGLAVGGAIVLLVLHALLVSTLVDSLTARLDEDAALLARSGVPAVRAAEQVGRPADTLVAVVGPDGGLAAAAGGPLDVGEGVEAVDATGLLPSTELAALRADPGRTVVTGRSVVPLSHRFRSPLVVARGVAAPDGTTYVVLVAAGQDQQTDAVSTTAVLLVLVWPFVVALGAATVWWRVGRTLRSVELIRARVEELGATSVAASVPVPDTGDEVAALATTMNAMLARLEGARATQRRFVADASHELRSPVATLHGLGELLDPADPAAVAELRPILRGETTRLARLVDDLLLLSRADDGRLVLAREPVDLAGVVRSEAARARAVAGAVAVRDDAGEVEVVGDRLRLAQVCRNLVDNALQHARGEVRVGLERTGTGVRLVVDDDGPGVPPADRERVLERFVRLDASRGRHTGGSGLGLAIVADLVARHGGTVRVEDSPLGGARVVVQLPAGPLGRVPDSRSAAS
ncbi:sensor histidine kinase [Lapillicoccus jejuensis]|uniref:histidine kinase n=1 Tax=Lapillicoccus jejuensis TaxID=402171 RepID=A0A542E159_9MICO|nr:HAMP domain-containing sensor histidine kinase [Lapillicoccus jejuensis]TQJ09009.1 signal transduction histidine kinase [Lapillicoccus jejuensis]